MTPMSDRLFVKTSIEERVATLTIDHPPVNALNQPTLLELNEAVDELIADSEVHAVVITGAGQLAFVAGADITEFGKLENADQAKQVSQSVHAIYNKIEGAPKPFIAAINGV